MAILHWKQGLLRDKIHTHDLASFRQIEVYYLPRFINGYEGKLQVPLREYFAE